MVEPVQTLIRHTKNVYFFRCFRDNIIIEAQLRHN